MSQREGSDHRIYRIRGKATKSRRKRANAKGEKTAYHPSTTVIAVCPAPEDHPK